MVSITFLVIAFAGAVYLMQSTKTRSRLAENKARIVALFMVIVVAGLIIIFNGSNGIFWDPSQMTGLLYCLVYFCKFLYYFTVFAETNYTLIVIILVFYFRGTLMLYGPLNVFLWHYI